MILNIVYQIIIYPFLLLVFLILSLFNKKIKQGLMLRFEPWPTVEKSSLPLYWFHVSSGEIEYAKPLMRELKKTLHCKILVTYFSPSVIGNIKKTPEIDYYCAAPWDFSWSMKKFIRRFNPKVLALARTDLWPQMLLQAKNSKIKTFLFSATLSSHSARVASFWGRQFYSLVLENLDHISCVTQEDADHFKKILPTVSISVDGDTRFDQVFWRLENSKVNENIKNLIPKNKTIFIAGSTWPEDEAILIPAIKNLKNIFTIFVPHEVNPSHIAHLKSQLSGCDCVVVDKVGILAPLYSLADFAFVGGSFKKSVHSVMEAAASGCYTVVGPYHFNNREALLLKSKGLLKEFSSSKELENLLSQRPPVAKNQIIDFCKSQTGATQKCIKQLN